MLHQLLDSGPGRGSPAGAVAGLSVSLGAHALAFGALSIGALLAVGTVTPPPQSLSSIERIVFFSPPPPAAAAAAAPLARRPSREIRERKPRQEPLSEMIQPEIIPEELPAADAGIEDWTEDDEIWEEGIPSGHPDGIPGGIPGGAPRGIVGGDPNGVIGGHRDGIGRGEGLLPPPDEAVPLIGEISPPQRILLVTPDYPRTARRARLEGTVHLEVVIGRDGAVEKVTVLAGNVLFRQAAVEAVEQWRYRPAMQSGRPLKIYMEVVVEFRLN